MEIESRAGDTHTTLDRPSVSFIHAQDKDHGVGLCSLLGTDYERKKQKLKQELSLDYQKYVTEKKALKSCKSQLQPLSISLPIDERKSVRDKLREERHKEYNLFLKSQHKSRNFTCGQPPSEHKVRRRSNVKAGGIQEVDGLPISSSPSPLPLTPLPLSEQNPELETVEAGSSRRTWNHGHQRQRALDLLKQMELRSEEQLHADREEELEFSDQKKDRHSQEPEDRGQTISWEDRDKRKPWDIKQMKPPAVHPQCYNTPVWKSNMTEAARTRSDSHKEKAKFSTGLLIGVTEDNGASQKRKEQYKEELLKQIAQQHSNKMKERELELSVAATGVIDPEKKPDRLKQLGALNRHDRDRDVPHKPGVGVDAVADSQSPRDDKNTKGKNEGSNQAAVDLRAVSSPLKGRRTGTGTAPAFLSAASFNEEYYRNLSGTQGLAFPRFVGVPPPPAVSNTYQTPYDADYYYYGTRHPLDPHLLYDQTGLPGAARQPWIFQKPSAGKHSSSPLHLPHPSPPPRPSNRTEASSQHGASQLAMGLVGMDTSKQTRERALSYQEALQQQMKERVANKRKEREERQRYDAKLEAEMMVYNPWGKGGGGAPIKDDGGNLISDLKQMHKSNEEVYRNPASMGLRQVQNFLVQSSPTPNASHQQLPAFSNRPTTQQLHMQNRYKDDLRQQIEENRRKQEEERERIRKEEEKEEMRLAQQRARMKQQYEDEVRRAEERSKVAHRLNIESGAWRQEEKKRMEKPRIQASESHTSRQVPEQREPSPPVPILQRKPRSHQSARPSSVLSQFSSSGATSESSASAPYSPPVPAKRNQLRAKDDQQQKEVFRELSAQRRSLQRKRSELEDKLKWYQEEKHTHPPSRQRRHTKADPLDDHGSTRSPLSCVNSENIREFNQLKYRDTPSREVVLHIYPDPPKDEQSLDIQQQALLRQQQRAYKHVQRSNEDDAMLQLSHHDPRAKPVPLYRVRDSMLPFETTFLDVYGDDRPEELVPKQKSPQPPVKEYDSPIPSRSYGHDQVLIPTDQSPSESLHSAGSLTMQAELRPHSHDLITPDQDGGEHTCKSGGLSGDGGDMLSLRFSCSALERRVSVETVATEAWLRPGTAEGLCPARMTEHHLASIS